MGKKIGGDTMKIIWTFLQKLKIELLYNPAIPILGVYLEMTKTLIISCSFDKSHCDKCEVILLVLISISLIISHVEPLFMCLLAICMSSSKNCVFGTFTCFQLDCLLFCY